MLKLAAENTLIVNALYELKKEFDVSHVMNDIERSSPEQIKIDQDIQIKELATKGFMVGPISERNKEFLVKNSLKSMTVSQNMQTWVFQNEEPQIRFPGFTFFSDDPN
jgi:hypothetical protein